MTEKMEKMDKNGEAAQQSCVEEKWAGLSIDEERQRSPIRSDDRRPIEGECLGKAVRVRQSVRAMLDAVLAAISQLFWTT